MERATVTFHLPCHRRTALKMQHDKREAETAYDANIGAYLRFLQEEGRKQGFTIATDQQEVDAVYAIEERDHAAKKAAHDWLETQPDIWNWLP
jgi:hypothetical protein